MAVRPALAELPPNVDPETGEVLDEAPRPASVPDLPDLDAVRAFLWREHRVTIGPDDPILLLHTIHRAFLADYERLLDRHGQSLAARVEGSARHFGEDIKATVDQFRDQALTAGLDQRLEAMTAQVKLADQIHTRLKALRLHLLILIGVAFAASGLSLLILFTVVK